MTRGQIIQKTLAENGCADDYRHVVIAEIEKRLPDVDIKTCEDFSYLKVKCCDACHKFYPHYEMTLIELPDGSPAWVCDPIMWAIYPERHEALQRWANTSPEGKLLQQIFGEEE